MEAPRGAPCTIGGDLRAPSVAPLSPARTPTPAAVEKERVEAQEVRLGLDSLRGDLASLCQRFGLGDLGEPGELAERQRLQLVERAARLELDLRGTGVELDHLRRRCLELERDKAQAALAEDRALEEAKDARARERERYVENVDLERGIARVTQQCQENEAEMKRLRDVIASKDEELAAANKEGEERQQENERLAKNLTASMQECEMDREALEKLENESKDLFMRCVQADRDCIALRQELSEVTADAREMASFKADAAKLAIMLRDSKRDYDIIKAKNDDLCSKNTVLSDRLQTYTVKHSAQHKKMLMSVAGNTGKALLSAVFNAWKDGQNLESAQNEATELKSLLQAAQQDLESQKHAHAVLQEELRIVRAHNSTLTESTNAAKTEATKLQVSYNKLDGEHSALQASSEAWTKEGRRKLQEALTDGREKQAALEALAASHGKLIEQSESDAEQFRKDLESAMNENSTQTLMIEKLKKLYKDFQAEHDFQNCWKELREVKAESENRRLKIEKLERHCAGIHSINRAMCGSNRPTKAPFAYSNKTSANCFTLAGAKKTLTSGLRAEAESLYPTSARGQSGGDRWGRPADKDTTSLPAATERSRPLSARKARPTSGRGEVYVTMTKPNMATLVTA